MIPPHTEGKNPLHISAEALLECSMRTKKLLESARTEAYEEGRADLVEAILNDVEHLEEKYPVDIFPEPPEGWKKNLDEWCKTQGYRIDRISASYARWQEKVVLHNIKALLSDYKQTKI